MSISGLRVGHNHVIIKRRKEQKGHESNNSFSFLDCKNFERKINVFFTAFAIKFYEEKEKNDFFPPF